MKAALLKVFLLVSVCILVHGGKPKPFALGKFSVYSYSAQLTTDGYNLPASSVLPNPPAGAGAYWDAVASGQGQNIPDWIVFDLGRRDFSVTSFSFSAVGDNVHDPITFQLQTGISGDGPFFAYDGDSGSYFTAVAGTSATQTFTLAIPTTWRFWRWLILTKASPYQSYVVHVNFWGLSTTSPQPINNFVVADFSAQNTDNYINGFATNLLPTSNPYALPSIGWNAVNNFVPATPSWITLDLHAGAGANSLIVAFQFAGVGDTAHDVQDFNLWTAASANGPWNFVGSFVGAAGTSSIQTFNLPQTSSGRYWRFDIQSTYSQYQAYVTYVNFLVVPS